MCCALSQAANCIIFLGCRLVGCLDGLGVFTLILEVSAGEEKGWEPPPTPKPAIPHYVRLIITFGLAIFSCATQIELVIFFVRDVTHLMIQVTRCMHDSVCI